MIPSWIWTILFIAEELACLAAILMILRRPREPRAMLAWILALLLLPVVGLILFALVGEPRRHWHRLRRRRSQKRLKAHRDRETVSVGQSAAYRPGPEATALDNLISLARRLGAYPAIYGNDVAIYHDAQATFLALQLAIESAQSHVHLEYYIYQPDETGRAIRDLLIKKAGQGVECRVLLDYIGCWRLPRRFIRPMRKAGVQVAFSLPVVPWHGRWRVNYRNHRKIAIIDGQIGFTGSQNIGNEYAGRRARCGPWRDTHFKITGPGVHALREIFIHDWYYRTRQNLARAKYFPHPPISGPHIVQVVPSGPDQITTLMHQLLFAAVSTARKSIRVITPYFVPDTAMVMAFQSACYRGVRVQLIIPTCSDHRIVLWAGRSYYEELTRAGVEIYEHDATMLHSKVMIVDETWAMTGSANMDERSFRINFELTTMLYSPDLAEELNADFKAIRENSRRITLRQLTARSTPETLLLGLARLASPLL